jgi:hypothetical protein
MSPAPKILKRHATLCDSAKLMSPEERAQSFLLCVDMIPTIFKTMIQPTVTPSSEKADRNWRKLKNILPLCLLHKKGALKTPLRVRVLMRLVRDC